MARHRLEHIDGLRGIAAMLVLFQHVCEHYSQRAPVWATFSRSMSPFFLTYCDLGKVGVVAFFAISGFVVPFSFGGTAPRLRFVLSRMFRLYPAYWLSLALALLILPAIGHDHFSTLQAIANITLLQEGLHQKDVIPVYGTLPIEIIFYVFCFMLFHIGLLRAPAALFTAFAGCLLLAFVAGALRGHEHRVLPVGLPLYLAVMWFGTLMRLVVQEGDAAARRFALPMLAALIVAVPGAWSIAYDNASHTETVVADIAGFYLALAIFLGCVHRRWFSAPWLVWVGTISYSLYLFHPIALDVGDWIGHFLAWPLEGATLVLFTLIVSFAAAALVYNTVERPMIRLGRRVIDRLAARQLRPAAAA